MSNNFVQVGAASEIREQGRMRVNVEGRNLAIFYHEGEFHAVDNRCPHMGFPLSEGTVENGILTCHWHHARFDLACGDTFDLWADDVPSYPTEVRDGELYVAANPRGSRDPVEHWTERLNAGLRENLSLIVAKSVVHLMDSDLEYTEPVRMGVEFGTTYREDGWGSGLTTLGVMANLVDYARAEDVPRALYKGLTEVAGDTAGSAPFFEQEALNNRALSAERLNEWFRENIEVRDADGAERVLRTAIQGDIGEGELARMLFGAATDHLYRNTGHTLDFINKAFETLDRIGWEHAEQVLPTLVPGLAGASRAEENSSWRQPIDVAGLIFESREGLADRIDAGSEGAWAEPEDFVDVLLGDDPRPIVRQLDAAIADGASAEKLAASVVYAAALRIAQFGTSNEFNDWNTVHHTFSYANAVHGAARRTDGPEAYRGIYDAAIKIYLDRFLNTPPARIPKKEKTGRPAQEVLEDLVGTFDIEGADEVDRAGRLTAEYVDNGGEVDALAEALTGKLLREDAGFHPNQNLEGAFSQLNHQEPERRRVFLIAAARFLSAHTPTRRSGEQTFEIAQRLHRGENIHEDDI
jgi:nitrite reductase/ring-hydroxylating ferredoxin subunit